MHAFGASMAMAAFVLLCLSLLLATVTAEYDDPSVWQAECLGADELYTLTVDSCQLAFNVESSGGPVAPSRYSLLAVNTDCENCAPQHVLSSNTSEVGCARLWTPFQWNFTIWDSVKDAEVMGSCLEVTLGERGHYNITAQFSGVNPTIEGINIETIVEPDDALSALWIWIFAIFLPVVMLNFTGASMAVWLRRKLHACTRSAAAAASSSSNNNKAEAGADGAYILHASSSSSATPAKSGNKDESNQLASPSTPRHLQLQDEPHSFWEALVSPLSLGVDTWHDKPSFDAGLPKCSAVGFVGGSEGVDPESGDVLNTPLISKADGVRFRGGNGVIEDSSNNNDNKSAVSTPRASVKRVSTRVDCLDTFRGACLGLMIFVNYGGGGYWFLDHAAWNGLTFADLLFPWFMWVMGCSMALSYRKLHTSEFRGGSDDAYVQLAIKQAEQAEKLALNRSTSTQQAEQQLGAGATFNRDGTETEEDGDGTSPRKYEVSTTSQGWSEIHSVPGTPTKSPSGSSSAQGARAAQLALLDAANSGPETDVIRTPAAPPTNAEAPWVLWQRVLRRTAILFALGLFLNNGFDVTGPSGAWRIPGVLQYFSISTFVVAGTVLGCRKATADLLAGYEMRMLAAGRLKWSQKSPPPCVPAAESSAADLWYDFKASVMYCYYYEYVVMLAIFLVFVSICLFGSAPGCPAGYAGAGGLADMGEDEYCTGGIHRYIDVQVFGENHIYDGPTCKSLYGCQTYDPEGLLGSLTACTLSYFGLVTGRILLHFPGHAQRLQRLVGLGSVLCLLAGILCGFSQNDGLIPVNKNLWSASFGLVTAGGGMIGLAATYVFVDMYRMWSGSPFRYLGLNSILVFCSHEILQYYFPFSWELQYPTHMSLMFMNVVGVSMWILIARYCDSIKFYVKI